MFLPTPPLARARQEPETKMVTETRFDSSPDVWVAQDHDLQCGASLIERAVHSSGLDFSTSGPRSYYFFAVMSSRPGSKK